MPKKRAPEWQRKPRSLTSKACFGDELPDGGRFEGIGEYQFPGHSAREHGRRLLFSAMAQVNPQVLQSLMDGPYRVALECGIDLSREPPSPRKEILAAVRRVRKAARAWCARWRLVDSWCEDLASDTVLGWVRDPERKGRWAAEEWEWIHDASFPRFCDFGFKLSGWSFLLKTWNDFEADAWNAFQKHLSEYRERAEGAAVDKHRLVRTRLKRKPDHYLWLARHFFGEKTSDIARFGADAPSAEAVRKAVNRLARDIALTLPSQLPRP